MMLYKNTKVKVCSPDGDTDYFNIEAGVLQGDTLAQYLFIIWDLMKENSFKLAKERNRTNPADYSNDIAFVANSLTQAESLLNSLKRTAGDIGLHVSADKTPYMCFNQRGNISTLKGGPLKLVDKSTYFGKCLINWEWHQRMTSKGMDSYQLAIGQIEVRPDR